MNDDIKRKIQKIADTYKFIPQSRQCIEECSELIQAICKYHRKWNDSLLSDSHDCEERTHINRGNCRL